MPRNLRVVVSDDELDDDTTAAGPTTTPDELPSPSSPPPPTHANNPVPITPLNISDDDQDDFITVPDDFSTPSPPAFPAPSSPVRSDPNTQNAAANPRIVPIDQYLRRLGLCIRHEWLEACLDSISGTMHGYDGLDYGSKARKIFEQFLFADMNECGAGVLPENIGMMHKAELDGPLVLQVDEMVNISAPIKERYQNAPAGSKRCLKLSMTDGVQRVFGIEYRPIKELEVLASSGFKIVVRNVHVRRGLLMLVPEIVSFLGGMVDDLDQARQRLVSEVNKPPRGKRKHGGVPLSRRASLVAWSTNVGTDGVMERNVTSIPAPQRTNSAQLAQQTYSPARPNQLQEITMEEVGNSNEESSLFNQSRDSEHMRTWGRHDGISILQETSFINEETSTNQETNAAQFRDGWNKRVMDESITIINEEPSIGHGGDNSNIIEENDMVIDDERSPVNNRRDLEQMKAGGLHVTDRSTSARGSVMVNDDEAGDTTMDLINDDAKDDKFEVKNSPFTYMSSLLAQWNADENQSKPFIRGRIKCFLTGVKSKFGFQGKFDLDVYIDDGSLISLVKIDHNVIQKWVGHTPEEVVAALRSPNTEADMRQTMRNFQDFLRQFEGTMIIEINECSDLPIAIEMSQGCSSDDAALLLKRLKAKEQ